MDDIALDIKERLSVLNATHPSHIDLQVNDLSHFVASLNGPAVGVVAVVKSSLIQRIANWCRSSKNQRYIPIIHRPEGLVLVPNQGQFALCLFDDSLRIWSSTPIELSLLASEVNECFISIIHDNSSLHNDNLDYLHFDGAVPLKPVVFHNWLDETECPGRAVQTPFLLESSGSDEIMLENIFMHPPTPILSPAMTLSPLTSFSDTDSLSPAFSSPMNSPLSSPGYLEFNSGRYNASMNFILNDIPLQGTVTPRDVFPQVELVDDEPMELGESGLLRSPCPPALEFSFADVMSNVASQNDSASSCASLHPEALSLMSEDRISSQGQHSQARSLYLLPSSSMLHSSNDICSRALPQTHRRHSVSASNASSSAAFPAQKTSRRNKSVSDNDDDEDDEYNPVLRGSPKTRKAFDSSKKVKRKVSHKTERPAGRLQFSRTTKFPKKFQCENCTRMFTRPTDVTRHRLTCEANPEREKKEPCYYCAEEAPIRGDSARRHWRSDACHYGAIARGITPYPRDVD